MPRATWRSGGHRVRASRRSFPGRSALRRPGGARPVRRARRDPQPLETVVLFRVVGGDESELIAFDQDDSQEIAADIAERVLVYFKQQYANEGYRQPNVVPAGYMPANKVVYRYLPLLRAIRSLRAFRYDAYGRFGLRYGGQELRRRAHEVLSSRTDIRYEGSLFRYPGGPKRSRIAGTCSRSRERRSAWTCRAAATSAPG